MKISPAKKAKLKARFNPDFHPRHPAGHPDGGKFMAKGSADYKAAFKEYTATKKSASKKKGDALKVYEETLHHLTAGGGTGLGGKVRMDYLQKTYESNTSLQSKHPSFASFLKAIRDDVFSVGVRDSPAHMSNPKSANSNKSLASNGLVVNKDARDRIASKLSANKKLAKSNEALVGAFPKIIDSRVSNSIEKKGSIGDHSVVIRVKPPSTSLLPRSKSSDITTANSASMVKASPIHILIDGVYDKTESADQRTSLRLALKARSMINEAIKDIPDGTIVTNTPYKDDGYGEDRFKMYKAAGFSDDMHAMIVKGKFKPITLKEISILKSLNHVAK